MDMIHSKCYELDITPRNIFGGYVNDINIPLNMKFYTIRTSALTQLYRLYKHF